MDNNNIIVSSRIRLARNIDGYAFSNIMTNSEAKEVLNLVFHTLDQIGNFNCYKMNAINKDMLEEYLVDHVISRELINNAEISGLAVSYDNSVTIMVNEEDHLRQQCILKGLNLKKAYDIINDIDSELSSNLKFSFDTKLGYLTACPSNVGTGIRASVMLFLPALTITNNIQEIINTVGKLGICVRGAYGEGSNATGYLYQVSNQITLGKSEQEIIQLVESTVFKICDLENSARNELIKNNEVSLRDDILRAYGILSNCYSISSIEAREFLSKVKLGVGLDIIILRDKEIIDELLDQISAVKINKLSSSVLSDEKRDIFRAQYINKVLKNMKIN